MVRLGFECSPLVASALSMMPGEPHPGGRWLDPVDPVFMKYVILLRKSHFSSDHSITKNLMLCLPGIGRNRRMKGRGDVTNKDISYWHYVCLRPSSWLRAGLSIWGQ